MSKNIVIVESPAKAKTIEKYLGKDFTVVASYGHVRDLISKDGAVDPDHGFAMKYELVKRNQQHVKKITDLVKKAETLYLATDPDREGEAISWHLYEILQQAGVLKDKTIHRVVFHEITQKAVQDAVQNPRTLAQNLINAQLARRALDHLVGFKLSPLLWKKIKFGLSAGRVQSPALRMITEREIEITEFKPKEYWSITAENQKEKSKFSAKLTVYKTKKLTQFSIVNQESAHQAKEDLLKQAQGKLTVHKVEKKQRKRSPAAPFTTSTLQQDAGRKLGFNAKRTMDAAQKLYENGLITYMRTDSVNLAKEAIDNIRDYIVKNYGQDQVPNKANVYKTKSKNAQEAHEAIRPTDVNNTIQTLKLPDDQAKLYDLIWKRTVACQMVVAILDTVSIDFACGSADNLFRASGSTIKEPGFMQVYQESSDDNHQEEAQPKLPPFEQGESITLLDIKADQHFTEPPPRYSEASLVKNLEEYGIGRPSTYASIISTLQDRKYVEKDKNRFTPTDIGEVVNKFLTEHFDKYVDYSFTANLEDQLDAISRGEKEWVPVLDDFWIGFKARIDEKETSISRQDVIQARELGTDPKTGKPVSARIGKYGPFVQIGTKEDEEKPQFAPLRSGQKVQAITLEEALELFKLPRTLGETETGEKISTNIGRFGPYVQYGKKYVSLKKEDDPYTITLERAFELIEEKKEKELKNTLKSFDEYNIKVVKGRFGPYITDGSQNVKLPKDQDIEALTLEVCQELIQQAIEKSKPKKKTAKKTTKKTAEKTAEQAEEAGSEKKTTKKSTTKKTSTKKTTKKADA